VPTEQLPNDANASPAPLPAPDVIMP